MVVEGEEPQLVGQVEAKEEVVVVVVVVVALAYVTALVSLAYEWSQEDGFYSGA